MAAEWGLQAMIRPKDDDDDSYCFGSIDIKKEYDQALLFCYPHLFHDHHLLNPATMEQQTAVNSVTDDVDHLNYNQLYNNPFNYDDHQLPPPPADDVQINHLHNYNDQSAGDDQEIIQRDQDQQEIKTFKASQLITSAPKLIKKRKNQQKKVVVQVTATGLSSDPWAWRKYGQKPIKGSIYPRSYYRCSSSKGCTARKQVEQNCNDSSIYILTYTGEHNHPQPTRRNSLAGINRNQRFKATTKTSPTDNDVVAKSKGLSSFDDDHSPPLTNINSAASSMEDELVVLQQSNIKCEINHQGHSKMMMMMPEINEDYMVFSDDFFEGLEDLGGYKMESSSNNYSSTKQFPHVFC